MRYGIWQIVTAEDKAERELDIERQTKNQCIRAAWASGQQPTDKPEATWDHLNDEQIAQLGPPAQRGDWRLRVTLHTEPRPNEEPDSNDMGFA